MTALRLFGDLLLVVGVVSGVFGLWCAVGGLRVVVSNRTDERQSGSRSAKFAVSFILAGLALTFGGLWLADWAGS
jgi:hypothetical protein